MRSVARGSLLWKGSTPPPQPRWQPGGQPSAVHDLSPSLHSLFGTLWPCGLHFSCLLFGYPVVFVHDAPLCPTSWRLPSYLPQNPLATHCGALLTRLCLKPQVIAKRQLHSYIPSPADDAPSPRPRYAVRRAYRGHANFEEAGTPNPGAPSGLSLPRCLPLSLQGRVLDDLLRRKLRNGLWLGLLLLSSHSCSLLAYHLRSHPELLGTCRGY